VFAWTKGIEAVQTFCKRRGVICDFVRISFMDGPASQGGK